MTHATQVPNLCDLRAHAVHHDNGCFVATEISDNNRHGRKTCQFRGVLATIAGDDFKISIIQWPSDTGDKDTVICDAFNGLLHGIIVPYLKGMVWKRVQLCKQNLLNYFLLLFGLLWRHCFRACLACIEKHKQAKGEPPAGMLALYEFLHKREIDKAEKIVGLQNLYKK